MINDDLRRLSCSSISSRRTSICSSRISEIPVENIAQQSKVATLQWQLKEVEKSREMYKAVMKQVVTFLEKAHRSLELLGNRLNTKQTVPRSKSEHQIVPADDYSTFRDFTLRRPQKDELSPEEVPPEKLSQEAFRLLRTAQSLLNTEEPKLSDPPEDLEFLAQVAREFPAPLAEVKPQRTTSFSMNPKLLTPDKDPRIATAFNRKLSLQLNETRRITYKYREKSVNSNFLSSTFNCAQEKPNFKNEPEKSDSPPAGSVSSVEDESGFSSMNSFQEVGLPEVPAKNLLPKSMMETSNVADDVKLWQKPDSINHQRWNSTPCSTTKQTVNVLWV